MQGEGCDLHLPSRIFSIKLGEIGVNISEERVIEAYTNFFQKRGGRLELGGRTKAGFHQSPSGIEFFVAVRDSWRLEMLYDDSSGNSTITVYSGFRSEDAGVVWDKHDLPSGTASFTKIEKADGPFEGGCDFCFVSEERHFSHGELWDRSLQIPAYRGYYSDGVARWELRYVDGRAAGRDGIPLGKLFWGNGNVMAEEYGDSIVGRNRPLADGPAYLEYYPDGTVACKVFAVKGKVVGDPERFHPCGGRKLGESQRDFQGLEDWRKWRAAGRGSGAIILGTEPSLTADHISSQLAKESLLSKRTSAKMTDGEPLPRSKITPTVGNPGAIRPKNHRCVK